MNLYRIEIQLSEQWFGSIEETVLKKSAVQVGDELTS